MFNVEISFRYQQRPDESAVSHGVYGLLVELSRSGQILDDEWPITFGRNCCQAVVCCPEAGSLRVRRTNKWVQKALAALRSHGLRKPTLRLLGKALETSHIDHCRRPTWYILVTNYLSNDPPICCGDHYLPVPLYKIPPTHSDGNFYDLLQWQRAWRAFDALQMACGAGERFATRQISSASSKLSEAGRELCDRIHKASGIPTYYYLYRGGDPSTAAELRRRCPICGGDWLLPKPLHRLFDFKCDKCRLVSNIAWGHERQDTPQP